MLDIIKQDLLEVEKPARYVGGEYNEVRKNINSVKLKIALCFPDLYEIGMSNYDFNCAYNILNQIDSVLCERVFAPWVDFENCLRKRKIEIYTLESKESIKKFDMILFIVPDVLDYTNMLNILNLGNIPIFSKVRKNNFPLIGAALCNITNPYPIADFFEIILMGDLEELYIKMARELIYNNNLTRNNILEKLHFIDGVYIPSLESYNVRCGYIKNIDNIEINPNMIVPNLYLNKDELNFELSKGSLRNGTLRTKNINKLIKNIKETIEKTGIKNVNLISDDINSIRNLKLIVDKTKGLLKNVNVSIKGLEFNNENLPIYNEIKDNIKLINIDIGASSYRLRKMLSYDLTDDEIINKCILAYENNWNTVVLEEYIGIPSEKYDDIENVVNLVKKIENKINNYNNKNSKFNIIIKTKYFIPAPNTKYQFFSQNTVQKLDLKIKYLNERLQGNRHIYEPVFNSVIKGILLRGDKDVSKILYEAYKKGAKYDRYTNNGNIKVWKSILNNFEYYKYIYNTSDINDKFVWDNIIVKNKDLFKEEYKKIEKISMVE